MDCGDPSCHDKQEMFRMATEAVSSTTHKLGFTGRKGREATRCIHTKKENEFTVRDEKGNLHECPPTRELLGRHSWTLVSEYTAIDV